MLIIVYFITVICILPTYNGLQLFDPPFVIYPELTHRERWGYYYLLRLQLWDWIERAEYYKTRMQMDGHMQCVWASLGKYMWSSSWTVGRTFSGLISQLDNKSRSIVRVPNFSIFSIYGLRILHARCMCTTQKHTIRSIFPHWCTRRNARVEQTKWLKQRADIFLRKFP